MLFNACKAFPGFIEDKYSRIFIVLMNIILDAPPRFSGRLYKSAFTTIFATTVNFDTDISLCFVLIQKRGNP